MKKNKKSDCVQMKWDIQQKIEQEYEGLSDKEKYERIYIKVKNNPKLSKFAKFMKIENSEPAKP